MVVFASLFWLGLALLALTLLDRYLPEVDPGLLVALAATVLILTHSAHYIRRARRLAYLHGHAVAIGPKQHPDLYVRLKSACVRLKIDVLPGMYLFQDTRLGTSFSLRLRGGDYIALNSELIDTLTERQGAIDFYIGFELARLYDQYRRWALFLFPASVIPLFGPAYARARVYAHDRYGLQACKTAVDAAYALAVLASGSRRWKSLNIAQFAAQVEANRRFWMSVIELSSAVPWLSKRIVRLRALTTESDTLLPRRHALAFLVALCTPHFGITSLAGVARLLCTLLWLCLIVFAGTVAYQELQQGGLLYQWRGQMFGHDTTQSRSAPAVMPRRTSPDPAAVATAEQRDPGAALDDDLELLGKVMQLQFTKHGGIPCEVKDTRELKLKYRADRYAFSCSEPVVYTLVGAGEFIPGKPPYLRSYHWKKAEFVENNANDFGTSQ